MRYAAYENWRSRYFRLHLLSCRHVSGWRLRIDDLGDDCRWHGLGEQPSPERAMREALSRARSAEPYEALHCRICIADGWTDAINHQWRRER